MNNYFELISDDLFDGIAVIDNNRRITHWNRSAEEITGYKSKQVLNKHCFTDMLEYIDEDGLKLCKDYCPLLATIKEGKKLEKSVYLRHKDGYRIPILLRMLPLRDEEEEIIGAVEIFRYDSGSKLDNTEEKDYYNIIERKKNLLKEEINKKVELVNEFGISAGIIVIEVINLFNIVANYSSILSNELLKAIANTLKNNLAFIDTSIHYTEGRFIILIDDIYQGDLEVIANKVEFLVNNTDIKLSSSERIEAEISVISYLIKDDDNYDFIKDSLKI
ncbi:PAS domain-containing protein [Orenia marismortui]|uniref:PAS domain-containing protein n=1 Tax=Orenia marismortui TaxID=46469 RepID=UPI0003609461|nr:PAS domain-containing protein [Orenia marismortui]